MYAIRSYYDTFHRRLGKIMWDRCGMSRDANGLKGAIQEIKELREDYWQDVRVLGNGESFNQSLEKAGRVADWGCRVAGSAVRVTQGQAAGGTRRTRQAAVQHGGADEEG